ncbi:hypothetical protein FRB99_008761 [Tulasnella sp. 403]|nr:hypothetical protein FRB99_008761 [Tulasnella sp. 403]
MAFYVPHPQQSAAKAKIDGFQSNQQHPPSPTNTFDPSVFFTGPMFPDAFRHPSATNTSIDFADGLISMMSNNPSDNQSNPNHQQGHPPQQPSQQQQNPQQGAPHLNLNIPQNLFDMSHFPGPLSSFQQQQQQQGQQQGQQQQAGQRRHTPTRDDALDSPASLQTTHSFFSDNPNPHSQHNPFAAPSSIPPYLNAHRPETPGTSVIGSPSDSANPNPTTSPFPTHASHARMHGHRSPSIGPGSHSRSRSRSRTSKPPPASRNGIVKGGPKRQSISSTPEETQLPTPAGAAGALPPPSRPQAILIPSGHPSQHTHHLSHEFTPHQLNSLGPHPISPLGIHSTQTAPSAWFVQNNTVSPNQTNHHVNGAVEPGSFGIDHQDGLHTQSFGQALSATQPRSLSLGTSPKPGTSASASVLAGTLGSSIPGKDAAVLAMDAAAKQAAILNEKRRRRRESHNAVERRRRDNINEKISELSTLLPECMLDPNGTSAGASSNPIPTTPEGLLPSNTSIADDEGKETPAMKANKGIILRKSVEYIRYLQQLVRVQASRNRELESQLAHYRGPSNSNDMDTANSSAGTGASSTPGGTNSTSTANHGPAIAHDGNINGNPNGSSPFGMLDSLAGIDEDGMSGLILSNLSPEDTTFHTHTLSKLPEDTTNGLSKMGSTVDASPPNSNSEEEEERGRGPVRGRRVGYSNGAGSSSVSGRKGLGDGGFGRDDSAELELESAVSDGESRERMMD